MILNKIVEYKTLELESQKRKQSLKDVQLKAQDQKPALNFLQNFKDDDINIIAEVKKASPSAGVIRENFDPIRIAHNYEEAGAKSLSVLTDENFFQGSLDYLKDIRQHVALPILRKDFTLEEYHIFEGRAEGADAILLIAAILDEFQLKDYSDLIEELGMTALVEVHNQEELEKVKFTPNLLGINNRNLQTFETDVQTTLDLMKMINPNETKIISESGLKDHKTLFELKNAGVSGFLIGESLLRTSDEKAKLKGLIYGDKS